MHLSDFDFTLPEHLIALYPPAERDGARLLHIHVGQQQLSDRMIVDLPDIFRAGDVLVLNTTRVIPAALHGVRRRHTAMQGDVITAIEVNLHKKLGIAHWRAFARPVKRLKLGEYIEFAYNFKALVQDILPTGELELIFEDAHSKLSDDVFFSRLHDVGQMPLPPYIAHKREITKEDDDRYQTIFGNVLGSVAAPTASLHFTERLFDAIKDKGVEIQNVTLHVGAGTFLPVKTENLDDHVMHAEWGSVSTQTAEALNSAKRAGRRIIPVGTTALRLLESAAADDGVLSPFEGETDIFIRPGYQFKAIDALLTNFHLPKSTLFMLVCALGGYELMQQAYTHAILQNYRFYSYGDACLIER